VRTESFVCDGCGNPIEGDGRWPRNDMLVLSLGLKPIPPEKRSDSVYAVMQKPMLDGAKHFYFHNLKCLGAWVAFWETPVLTTRPA
jgi:hypothetical protein